MADKNQNTLNEFEQVDLEFKRMQIAVFREQLQEREDKRRALDSRREKQTVEWKKGEIIRERKQTICKHRKGGRDNKFAKGDGNSYSINKNTFPDGREVISCTRCGKEVEKPHRTLKRANPKLYAQMWDEWVRWNEFPTDNTPSGTQIFLISAA